MQLRIADIFKHVRCERLCPQRDSFGWSGQRSAIGEYKAGSITSDKIAEAQYRKTSRLPMRMQRHGIAGSNVRIEYAQWIILKEQRVMEWRSA